MFSGLETAERDVDALGLPPELAARRRALSTQRFDAAEKRAHAVLPLREQAHEGLFAHAGGEADSAHCLHLEAVARYAIDKCQQRGRTDDVQSDERDPDVIAEWKR